MIKRTFFIIFFLISNGLIYAEDNLLKCHSELRSAVERIQIIPEVEDMIAEVLKEGPLRIELNKNLPEQFQGYWESSNRTIYITKLGQSSDCLLALTLLFEIHNAKRTADFAKIDHLASTRQIDREEFIENIEYIEYENALSTSHFLAQGVEKGLFQANCFWEVSNTFEEHLAIQKSNGHSEFIGQGYDQLAGFQ